MLLVGTLVAGPVALVGQEPAAADSAGAGPSDASSEKSLLLIPLLEMYAPTLGYAYAGHWRRGIPSGLARVVGFALVAPGGRFIFGEGAAYCSGTCTVGSVLLIGGTALAIVDAMYLAHRDNQRLRAQRARVQVAPLLYGARPGMSVRIEWE